MVTFPPTLFLIQLFRKSKKRQTHIKKIKSNLAKNQKLARTVSATSSETEPQEIESKRKDRRKKKSKLWPWWCKIVGYILSVVFLSVSIFFIIVGGISLGDEKVKRWLTVFVTSLLSEIVLKEPIKVSK